MNRFDDQARLTFHYAREEANALGQAMVGPAHLLLGLSRLTDPVRDVLVAAGAPVEEWREMVKRQLPKSSGQMIDAPSITPLGRQVMETAAKLAHRHGARIVGPQFMLLALLESPDELTQTMLARLSSPSKILRGELVALPTSEEPESPDRAEAQAALRELIQLRRDCSGRPPGDMGRTELLGLMAASGAVNLLSDLEPLLYDWLTGHDVPDDEKHGILTLLLGLALRRAP